jgi:hypothetical protein
MLTFKKTKYLILLLLVLIGFIFNGELFIFHLDNFQASYYRADFYFDEIPKEASNERVLEEFIDAGKRNKVDFFIVDYSMKSAFFKEKIIYGTKGALEEINSKGIKDKKYKSIFLGDVDVQMKDIEQLDDIKKYTYFYFVGDYSNYQNIRDFKVDLVNKYSGGFPRKYGSDREMFLNLATIWAVILIFLFMLTLYEISYKKKETIVHVFLGTDLKTLFYKNIASDFVFILLLFIIVPIILYPITNSYFQYSFIGLFFLIAIIINSLINALMLKINFKRDIYSNASGRKFLKINYSVKILVTFIAIAVLSVNFVTINEGIKYYKQHSFFEEHKNYKYYKLSYKNTNTIGKTDEDSDIINHKFYNAFYDKSLMFSDLSENFYSNYPVILLNRNSFDELKISYPGISTFKNQNIKNEITLFIPSNIGKNSLEYKNALMNVESLFPTNKNSLIDTYRYKDDIKVIGINYSAELKSDILNNPIIILDTSKPVMEVERGKDSRYYTRSRMYDISENESDEFLHKYELTNQINIQSNVFEAYENRLNIIMRSMKLSIVLSLLLLAIESSLIFFIILMEYRFNSKLMALQKILGYSILERNRKLILIIIFSSLMSILIMYVILKLGGFEIGIHFIWIGVILAVIEIIYVIIRAIAIEKRRITSILKGERV